MADEEANDGEGLPGPLVATLADPAGHGSRVPYLLGLLDGDDPDVRLAAGTALCLVAATDRRLRAVVAERLVDRLDEDAPVEVRHTVNYLDTRYPDAVGAAVSTLDAETRHRTRARLAEADSPVTGTNPDWTVVRTGDSREPRDEDDENEQSEGDHPDPGSVGVADDAGIRADSRVTTERRGRRPTGGATGDADGSRDGDRAGDAGRPDGDASTGTGVTAETLRTVSRRLSTVVDASGFDDLTVLSEGRRDRYGDVYRAAGRLDGQDYAVALTVYRDGGSHASFVGAFRSVMEGWEAVGDHHAVLPVYDWSARPRPWAAVEYAGGSLATHGDPANPVWTALELTGAVACAHRHGVVHGAIDPGNVVYRDVELDGTDRQPLLTNVGVASLPGDADDSTVERAGSPVPRGIDSRYAAPEHYDDDYGTVDAATDVYCLGTLLFRLVTGDHPYTGDSHAVREAVLSDVSVTDEADPGLPGPLERVLRKATARRKIKRYETVQAFERELRDVDDMGAGGRG